MKKTKIAVGLLAMYALSNSAYAGQIILRSSDRTYLEGGEHRYTFDTEGSLPAGAEVHSVRFIFRFTDPDDEFPAYLDYPDFVPKHTSKFLSTSAPSYSAPMPNAYVLQFRSGDNYVANYTRDVFTDKVVTRTNAASVSFSAAGIDLGTESSGNHLLSSTSTVEEGEVEYLGQTLDFTTHGPSHLIGCDIYGYNCEYFTGTNTYYYSDNFLRPITDTKLYDANFEFFGETYQSAVVQQLTDSGKLDFDLSVLGNTMLYSAELDVEYYEAAPVVPSDVPEPSTLWLGLAGLGVMNRLTRRRNPETESHNS